jgi:hypothetical protein
MFSMLPILKLVVILLFITAIIIWPRLRFGRHFGTDIYLSLLLLKHTNKLGKLPKKIPEYLMDKDLDYPFLLPYLMAKISRNIATKYYWVLPSILNAITITVAFIATNYLQEQVSLFAFVLAFLYPAYIEENNTLTARVLGLCIFNIAFLDVLLYLRTQNPYLLILFIACGLLIFLTHKFSSQNFILLSIFSAIFARDLLLISSIVILVVFIATIPTYRKILQGHWNVLKFWHEERDSMIAKTRDFFSLKFLADRVVKNAVFNLPLPIIILLPFVIVSFTKFSTIDMFSFIYLVMIAAIIIITTHIPFFAIFGEGWRYGAYLVVPTLIFLNTNIPYLNKNYLFLLTALLILLDIFMQIRINRSSEQLDDAMDVAEYLKKLKNRRMFPPPGYYAFFAYYTSHKIMSGISTNNLREICDSGWFFRTSADKYLKKYDVNTIIQAKNQNLKSEVKKLGFKKTFENKSFRVYLR